MWGKRVLVVHGHQGGEAMLVLTRKMGEEIVIGDNIKLIVNRIAGNRVTIGINAPGNVSILRGELEQGAVPHDAAGPQDPLLESA
jgi:carbon storage regulator CsrA